MEYTFFWKIENYSYCWHKYRKPLTSPEFSTEGLKGIDWTLKLFPRGESLEHIGNLSLFLCRSDDFVPNTLLLNYELSILTKDGLPLRTKKGEYAFQSGLTAGWFKFVQVDEVLVRRKSEYLPHDTLSICCKMWLGESPYEKIGRTRARTSIAVQKISFLHIVEGFSALEQNQTNTVKICYGIKEECTLTSSLFCTDGLCCEEKIMVEISPSVLDFFCKCQFFLLGASGNVIECGGESDPPDVPEYDIKLPLSLTKEVIMARKSEYLTDDKLSLLCECIFSTGLEFQSIEEIAYEIPTMADKIISNRETIGKVNESSALDDFKAIYSNQFLTDVELKTKTTSFSAHKIVLCARSPVFRDMLSSDMTEKNFDSIEIEDLEDDILNQLLLFLYCDNVENLLWETATKLYYAAEKYGIKRLKMVCSQFFEHNLTTQKAAELLLLADTYSDSGLKQVVEHFILKHDELIFGSDEWDNLSRTNSQLALKTMQLKYKRKN